jgi:hypothetical protein
MIPIAAVLARRRIAMTATVDFGGCFGDKRLDDRGARVFGRMVEKRSCTLRRLGGGRAEEVALGRFLGNDKVTAEAILAAASRPLWAASAHCHVLAIQDTSEINFQRHAGRVHGLGAGGNGRDRALFVHPVIAVEAESGALLGIAGAQLWTRDAAPAGRDYRGLAIEDKESYRWLVGADQAKAALGQAAHVTVITDREGDMFELFDRVPDERCDVLARVSRNRRTAADERLFVVADGWPEAHRYDIEIRAQPGRAARTATVAVRHGPVTIHRPRRCTDAGASASLDLFLVDVREVDGPATGAVHWRLLTSHAVEILEDALRIIAWYRQRWHVEQCFRTLKRQGLDIESSQVASAAALIKLSALAMVAAVRIMQLVLARDGTLARPASDVIAPDRVAVAEALVRELEGKTAAQKNPHEHGSLAWLSWIIARLGGWKGYKSERPPGPITMGHGWKQFEAIAHGWDLKDV